MAKVTDQNIPAELQDLYDAALGTSEWIPDDFVVKERHPFRIPELQGCRTIRPWIPRGAKVTWPMCEHRHVFGPCVQCFNKQPWDGGAEPDGRGPYSRTWWFNEAVGILPWYFNYFMRKTIDAHLGAEPPIWCAVEIDDDTFIKIEHPDNNYDGEAWLSAKKWPIGQDWRAYINSPNDDVSWCHIYLGDVSRLIGDDGPWWFNVYATPKNWEEETLTWNNRPKTWWYRKTVQINDPPHEQYGYHSFYIGKGLSCFITVTVGQVEFRFYPHENADPTKRPFWT